MNDIDNINKIKANIDYMFAGLDISKQQRNTLTNIFNMVFDGLVLINTKCAELNTKCDALEKALSTKADITTVKAITDVKKCVADISLIEFDTELNNVITTVNELLSNLKAGNTADGEN